MPGLKEDSWILIPASTLNLLRDVLIEAYEENLAYTD